MASEAVAVIRRFFELTAEGDPAAVSEVLHADVVWLGTRGGLDENQVLRGPDAVVKYLNEMREPWQRFEVKLERFIEAGDTVVVFVRETAQSRQGGPLMHTDVASLFRVRGQKIAEMRGYLDRDEALKILRAADQAKL